MLGLIWSPKSFYTQSSFNRNRTLVHPNPSRTSLSNCRTCQSARRVRQSVRRLVYLLKIWYAHRKTNFRVNSFYRCESKQWSIAETEMRRRGFGLRHRPCLRLGLRVVKRAHVCACIARTWMTYAAAKPERKTHMSACPSRRRCWCVSVLARCAQLTVHRSTHTRASCDVGTDDASIFKQEKRETTWLKRQMATDKLRQSSVFNFRFMRNVLYCWTKTAKINKLPSRVCITVSFRFFFNFRFLHACDQVNSRQALLIRWFFRFSLIDFVRLFHSRRQFHFVVLIHSFVFI